MRSQIITDPEFLSRSYLPDKLLHREKEKTQLSNSLKSLINTFIYGPSGSGKTTLVRLAIRDFNEKTSHVAVYIDCSLYQTTNSVLRETLSGLNVPVFSRSNYDLIKRLRSKTKSSRVVICLDHFKYLKEVDLINKLLGLGLSVAIISEKEEDYAKLDPLARSNITNVICLPEYTSDQAFDILLDRAKLALKEWSYTDAVIRKIAEQAKGNMALAINTLKTVALKAEGQNKTKIEEEDVPVNNCPMLELNRDENILLKILKEERSLPSGRLYALYEEKVGNPKSRRAFRNYMQGLCSKNLVRAVGEKSGRFYEVVEDKNVKGKA